MGQPNMQPNMMGGMGIPQNMGMGMQTNMPNL